MDGFTTDKITLSMNSPETGMPLTANVYHVDGIYETDGSLRDLSIGQLVMAICLDRAAELEAKIIEQMERMGRVTDNLEALTAIQEQLVNRGSGNYPNNVFSSDFTLQFSYYDSTGTKLIGTYTIDAEHPWSSLLGKDGFFDKAGISIDSTTSYDDAVAALTSSMNSLNSVSQKDMIELQSLTSKRDQSYDLISNSIKSLHQVLIGTSNNM